MRGRRDRDRGGWTDDTPLIQKRKSLIPAARMVETAERIICTLLLMADIPC